MNKNYTQSELIRYLLGELTEADRDELEEQYFCDNALFAQLQEAKDQLICAYVNDRLPPPQRQRFERHFLTLPERRTEVYWANALRRYQSEAGRAAAAGKAEKAPALSAVRRLLGAGSGQPWLLAGACATVALAVAAGFWALKSTQPEPQLARQESAPAVVAESPLPAPVRDIALQLQAEHLRGSGGAAEIAQLDATVRNVMLRLLVETAAAVEYRAELRFQDQETVVRTYAGLNIEKSGSARSIRLTIPARELPQNQAVDYQISLFDKSVEIGRYRFSVRPPLPQ